jgi:RNA polymerase subunit RPABC4/transcription elongation factor Spt4
MKTCRNCDKLLPDTSTKCPYCGTSTIIETMDCPHCLSEIDMGLSICPICKTRLFEEIKHSKDSIFGKSGRQKLELEITNRFYKAFQIRLIEEHNVALHQSYNDRLKNSEFIRSIEYRIKQLAESAESQAVKNKILRYQHDLVFEELIDYFIIRHCTDLNEVAYPERILKYQGLKFRQLNLSQLINDYLDYDKGDLAVYTDFVTMPPAKLKNAADSFLFPRKGETLFLIADRSISGNCKDGFALTNKAIYWKMLLEEPQRVYYHKLRDIRREEDWITINGMFFNVNKNLNLKLIRLLKKFRELFDENQELAS